VYEKKTQKENVKRKGRGKDLAVEVGVLDAGGSRRETNRGS